MSDIERLEKIINEQSVDIKELTASNHEIALAIRESTAESRATKEAVMEIKEKQSDLEKRIHTVEVAQAGDDARKEIWGWAQKAAITVFVAALIGGAMMAFYGSKG